MTILLSDLLHAHNFVQAVDDLVTYPRRQLDLPLAYQVGLVVPQIQKAIFTLKEKGVGPFLVAQGKPVRWCEYGKERQVMGKIALSYYQNIELEILEPTKGSEFYSHSLHPQGKIVLHHIGFLVSDINAWINRFTQHNLQVHVRGRLELGRLQIDFAYMDNPTESDFLLELISNPSARPRR